MRAMIQLDDPDDLDFTALVRPGDSVVCAQGLAEPVTLTRRLVAQRAAIGRFQLFVGPTYSDSFEPAHADFIDFRSYCGTGRNANLVAAGAMDVLPVHYSSLAALYDSRMLRADVVLLTVGEPDAQGRFNLGLTQDYVVDAARRARVVVLEVSARVPWVFGAELPPDVRPTLALHTDREPLMLAPSGSDAASAEAAIAHHVAAMVPDGATLELGIGALPESVLQALGGHRDLGIHSAVVGDGVAALVEAGVITNAHKPFDRGVCVAGLLMGSRRLYDHAHRNPQMRLAPSHETHGIDVLGRLPNFFALNGAIEVDLGGQVNAESSTGRYVGAVGGQLDFVRGANRSPGGRALMLLPSTACGGSVSRIVPRIADAVVTTPRSDVDAIVTEFGVAQLRGKTLAERARALISVAHPDHREALERAAARAPAR
jgi:acyl-CoA hydrolase